MRILVINNYFNNYFTINTLISPLFLLKITFSPIIKLFHKALKYQNDGKKKLYSHKTSIQIFYTHSGGA